MYTLNQEIPKFSRVNFTHLITSSHVESKLLPADLDFQLYYVGLYLTESWDLLDPAEPQGFPE